MFFLEMVNDPVCNERSLREKSCVIASMKTETITIFD